jgi:hypothetical protein
MRVNGIAIIYFPPPMDELHLSLTGHVDLGAINDETELVVDQVDFVPSSKMGPSPIKDLPKAPKAPKEAPELPSYLPPPIIPKKEEPTPLVFTPKEEAPKVSPVEADEPDAATEEEAYAKFLDSEWSDVAAQLPGVRAKITQAALSVIDVMQNMSRAPRWRLFNRQQFATQLQEVEKIAEQMVEQTFMGNADLLDPLYNNRIFYGPKEGENGAKEAFSSIQTLYEGVRTLQRQFLTGLPPETLARWYQAPANQQHSFFLLYDVILSQFNAVAISWSQLDDIVEKRRYVGRYPEYDFRPRGKSELFAAQFNEQAEAKFEAANVVERSRQLAEFMAESMAHNTFWVAGRFDERRPQIQATLTPDGVRGLQKPVITPQGMRPSGEAGPKSKPAAILRNVNTPILSAPHWNWADRHLAELVETVLFNSHVLKPDHGKTTLDLPQAEELSHLGKRTTLAQVIRGLSLQPATIFAAAQGLLPWVVHRPLKESNEWIDDLLSEYEMILQNRNEHDDDISDFMPLVREAVDMARQFDSLKDGEKARVWPPGAAQDDDTEALHPKSKLAFELDAWLLQSGKELLPVGQEALAKEPEHVRLVLEHYIDALRPHGSEIEAEQVLANLLSMIAQVPTLLALEADGQPQEPPSESSRWALTEMLTSSLYLDLVGLVIAQAAMPNGNPAELGQDEILQEGQDISLYQHAYERYVRTTEAALPLWMRHLRRLVYDILHGSNYGIVDLNLDGGIARASPEPSSVILRLDIAQLLTRSGILHHVLAKHEEKMRKLKEQPQGYATRFFKRLYPVLSDPLKKVRQFISAQPETEDMRLKRESVLIYRTHLLRSCIEVCGHLTVGAACYADVLSLFAIPHTRQRARSLILKAATQGGLTSAETAAIFDEGTALARSLGIAPIQGQAGALLEVLSAVTCKRGRALFGLPFLEQLRADHQPFLADFLADVIHLADIYKLREEDTVKHHNLFNWDEAAGFDFHHTPTLAITNGKILHFANKSPAEAGRLLVRNPVIYGSPPEKQMEPDLLDTMLEKEGKMKFVPGNLILEKDTIYFPACLVNDLLLVIQQRFVHNAVALKHALRAYIALHDEGRKILGEMTRPVSVQ